jgi:flagellin
VRINTNINAIDTQRNLNTINMSLSKSIERLSSGLRINRAGDDAAGLTISEKLRGQTKGLNQAIRNAQDGISMIQTAEGGLNETHSILQRMRELAVQGANDTLTDTDRGAISSELTSLKGEIDRIAGNTEFNTKKLLNGGMSTTLDATSEQQVGQLLTSSNVVVSQINVAGAVSATSFTMSAAGSTGVTLTATIGGATVSQTVTLSAMAVTANSSQTLNFNTLGVSMTLSGFSANATVSNLISDLTTGIRDTIVTAAGSASASFQVGANANQTISVAIDSAMTNANNGGNSFGAGGTFANLAAGVAAFAGAGATTANAQKLIQSLDDAISDVSANRANLGAVQNRLEHTIENLATSSENLTASESRIRDADMAAEMVGFTRSNILQQAGTSILAQANQLPQGILSLLR